MSNMDRCPTCHSPYDCECAQDAADARSDFEHRADMRILADAARAFAPRPSVPHQTSVRNRWED